MTKTAMFTPTQLVSCVEVPIKNDQNPEPPEFFTARISSMSGTGIVTARPNATARVTIIDDDDSKLMSH